MKWMDGLKFLDFNQDFFLRLLDSDFVFYKYLQFSSNTVLVI